MVWFNQSGGKPPQEPSCCRWCQSEFYGSASHRCQASPAPWLSHHHSTAYSAIGRAIVTPLWNGQWINGQAPFWEAASHLNLQKTDWHRKSEWRPRTWAHEVCVNHQWLASLWSCLPGHTLGQTHGPDPWWWRIALTRGKLRESLIAYSLPRTHLYLCSMESFWSNNKSSLLKMIYFGRATPHSAKRKCQPTWSVGKRFNIKMEIKSLAAGKI